MSEFEKESLSIKEKALLFSFVLHLAVIIALVIDVSFFDREFKEPEQIISVELVEIDELTQTTKIEEPKKKEQAPKKEDKKPKDAIAKSSVLPPIEKPAADAVPLPDAEKKIEKPVTPPEIKKVKKKPTIKRPEVKDQELIKEPENDEPFQSVLKNIITSEPEPFKAEEEPEEVNEEAKETVEETTQRAPLGERMTVTQLEALRRQLEGCWNVPIGAREADDLIVDVKLTVNPDKTVSSATIIDRDRYNSDGFFRAAADSALRAILSQECKTLVLPDGKYEQWKTITFRFNPSEMF
ncbi:MAG: hypothetical protein CMP22_01920 [Rickettsiales bacterium]|nr:hypothetical protein [Rickettsiales bacterium]|tara:strand:+ start:787 stop:1674 length:888 start_codon:yes stop_codon:yes gene_type:complete